VAVLAALLLSAPFLLFGLWLVNSPGLVTLTCRPGGPCTLTRKGALSVASAQRFELAELRGASLERRRGAMQGSENTYRAVLDLPGGPQPLSSRWEAERARAQEDVDAVLGWQARPQGALHVEHDGRRLSLGVGSAFLAVGVLLLGIAVRIASRRSGGAVPTL